MSSRQLLLPEVGPAGQAKIQALVKKGIESPPRRRARSQFFECLYSLRHVRTRLPIPHVNAGQARITGDQRHAVLHRTRHPVFISVVYPDAPFYRMADFEEDATEVTTEDLTVEDGQ